MCSAVNEHVVMQLVVIYAAAVVVVIIVVVVVVGKHVIGVGITKVVVACIRHFSQK